MNQNYIYLIFYAIVLIIAVAATYFTHMPIEVLSGLFLFIAGHGSASLPASPITTVRPL